MKRVKIGGQAVMEGVMMKNGNTYAVAVRKPDNEIEIKVDKCNPIGDKIPLFKLPIIRGVVNFIESLVVGIKTLTYSAEFYEDEEEEQKKNKAEKPVDKKNGENKEKKSDGESLSSAAIFGTVAFSVIFAVALFMMLPAFLTELIGKIIKNHFALSAIEGVIRLLIFLGYVALISLMKDIQRVFMYHGAEHKSINCLEAGDELTPENVLRHSRFHKRCGTSFLLVVMIISIIVFMFISFKTRWMRMVARLLLVPLIAGISYEFIMFAGKSNSKCSNILSKPGLWLQRLTTREPDIQMVEVAIKSVEAVLDWKAYQQAMKDGDIED